jgi:hypothetical protein
MLKQASLATLTVLVATSLSGCAGNFPTPTPRAGDYDQGYSDGCTSGKASQGSVSDEYRRDMGRYGGSPEYAKGWNQGYAKCSGKEDALNAAGGAR